MLLSNNDLLGPQWTKGSMDAIDGLSNLLGTVVVFIISIVGFGIVMAALAKNAFAGLYATNPRLWDKVDAAKKSTCEAIKSGTSKSGNKVLGAIGAIGVFVLSKLPNIKALTDFDGDQKLEASTYFMKAIPLMVLQIFIGVFIWKGYPAEFANKVSQVGTGVFDLVLKNVDPAYWITSIPDKFAIIQLSTDNAMDDFSKQVNTVAHKAANTYVGALSDMKKESRLTVGSEIEVKILEWMGRPEIEQYTNREMYDMSVATTIAYAPPNLDRINGKTNGKVTTFATYWPVNAFSSGVPAEDMEGKYLRIDIAFTKNSVKTSNITSVKCQMAIPATAYRSEGNKMCITVDEGTSTDIGFTTPNVAAGIANVDGTTFDVEISVESGKLHVTPQSSTYNKYVEKIRNINNVTNLYYEYDGNKHPITQIVMDAQVVSEAEFSPVNAKSGIASWNWRYGPTLIESIDSNTTNTDTSGGTRYDVNDPTDYKPEVEDDIN